MRQQSPLPLNCVVGASQHTLSTSASGKATISLNRTLEDGSVEEADVKDIRYPSYFGEGRVLGDSRAYASVRAKEKLVVYYIMKEDFVELIRCEIHVSGQTRRSARVVNTPATRRLYFCLFSPP